MNKTIKRIGLALLAALGILLAPNFAQAQQNLIVQTTLSAAVAAPASQGAPPVPYAQVQVASATGITAQAVNVNQTINTQNLWVIYVDREEMAVVGVNGLTLQVIRGYNSTVATSHASGQMVLYGKAAWFYSADPGTTFSQGGIGIAGGTACTVAGQYAFPWINVRTGAEWACSPTSLTYVPWFNNPLNPSLAVDFGTEASVAGATAVLGPLFRISGTNAITGWTAAVGQNATGEGGSQFCVYPTGAFTTTTAGNIAVATTAVAGKLDCWTWNASTSKWAPSY